LEKASETAEEEMDPLQKALKYKIELAFGLLFLVALIYWWVGSSQNKTIA
jgi:hypothetical protein